MSPKNVLIHQKQASKKKFKVDRSPSALTHFGAILTSFYEVVYSQDHFWKPPKGTFVFYHTHPVPKTAAQTI